MQLGPTNPQPHLLHEASFEILPQTLLCGPFLPLLPPVSFLIDTRCPCMSSGAHWFPQWIQGMMHWHHGSLCPLACMCPVPDRPAESENPGVLVPHCRAGLTPFPHKLITGDFSSCGCPHLRDEPTQDGRSFISTRDEANN